MKVLETLTYSCTSPDRLEELSHQLDMIISGFKSSLPKTEGLLLRPQAARLLAKKRAKEVKSKYLSLPPPSKRGKAKQDW